MSIFATTDQNKVLERYSILPEYKKAVLQSKELHEKIVTLGSGLEFTVEETGVLETIFGLTVMGIIPEESLVGELIEVFDFEKEAAESIKNWVGQEMLAPKTNISPLSIKNISSPSLIKPGAPTLKPIPNKQTATLKPSVTFPISSIPFKKPGAVSPADFRRPPTIMPSSVPRSSPLSGNQVKAPATAASGATPFILRKETTAIPAAPKFRLNINSKMFNPVKTQTGSAPLPPRPAKLEFGSVAIKKPENISVKVSSGNSEMVHYGGTIAANIGIPAAPISPASPNSPILPAAPEGKKPVDTVSSPEKEIEPKPAPIPTSPLKTPSWNSAPLPPTPAPRASANSEEISAKTAKVVNFTEGE